MLKQGLTSFSFLQTLFTLGVIGFISAVGWAENPFDRNRPIASMHFLTHRFDTLEREIQESKEKTKQLQLDLASEQLDTIGEKLEQFIVGENKKAKEHKKKIQGSLQAAQKELRFTRYLVTIEEIFKKGDEFSWERYRGADFATQASSCPEEAASPNQGDQFQAFLMREWDSSLVLSRCKFLWLNLVRNEISKLRLSDLKQVADALSGSDKEKDYRDRGYCLVGMSALEVGKSKADMESLVFAEELFSADFADTRVRPIARRKAAEANAYQLRILLKDKLFTESSWHQNWEQIWQESRFSPDLLQRMEPIPLGLFTDEGGNASALEKILQAESEPQLHLKLAWLYAGIGWHENALPHIQRAMDQADGIDLLYLNYFYGKSLEETFVHNPLTTPTGNLKDNWFGSIKNDFSTELDEIQGVYDRAVKLSMTFTASVDYPGEEISYMKGWLLGLQNYRSATQLDHFNQQTNNIMQIISGYHQALEHCPGSFFFRQQCFQMLVRDWRTKYFNDRIIGFNFHGSDGYYQLTFQGRSVIAFSPYVQLIRIIQFLDKVTYTQAENLRVADDVTTDLLIREFLSLPPYNRLIGQMRSPTADFVSMIPGLFLHLKNANRNENPDPLSTHRQPWRAVEAYQDLGRKYADRHLPLLAARAYHKSLLLVPTPGVRHQLQVLWQEIRQPPFQPSASPGPSLYLGQGSN